MLHVHSRPAFLPCKGILAKNNLFFKLLSNILFCLDANDNPEARHCSRYLRSVFVFSEREDVVVAALLGYPHNNSVHSQSPCYFALRGSTPVYHSVLILGAFDQEKALVEAFSVIVKTNCQTDRSSRALLLTRDVELDVPGDDGGGCDPVPGAAGEHLGQVGLGRPHLQHRHRAPVTVPEQRHPGQS